MNPTTEAAMRFFRWARLTLAKAAYFVRFFPIHHAQEIVEHDVLVCRAVICRGPVDKITPPGGGMYYTAPRIHAVGVIASRRAEANEHGRVWHEIVKQPRKLVDGVEVRRGDVVTFEETIEKREVPCY